MISQSMKFVQNIYNSKHFKDRAESQLFFHDINTFVHNPSDFCRIVMSCAESQEF